MDSGKVNLLAELLPKLRAQGDKILIFSQFVIMLNILETVMASLGILFVRLDGSTPGHERQALIDQYNNSPEITVFLLSTKACGLGINLTSANVVILYDIDFNPHNDAQAEDRAHRVGQTRPVQIYKLILKDSVEQHMLTLANFKLLLDNKVQNRHDTQRKGKAADEPVDVDPADEEKLMELCPALGSVDVVQVGEPSEKMHSATNQLQPLLKGKYMKGKKDNLKKKEKRTSKLKK